MIKKTTRKILHMTRQCYLLLLVCVVSLFDSCQKTPELIVSSPSSFEMNVTGGSGTITFMANRNWSASGSDSWVSVSPSSGSASDGPVTITVRGDANTSYEDRSATITIRMEELSHAVTVKQAANRGIVLPTQTFDLASDARSIEVTLKANIDYTVDISANWIKQTGTKALTSKTLTFTVEENTSYDGRSATISFKPQDSSVAEQAVTVRQAQKDAMIVKDATFNLPYGGGGVEVKVEANVSFDVKSGADWIHYVETKALNTSTVYLAVDENSTTSTREGKVEITQKDGSLKHTVTIRQAGQVAVTGIELNKSVLELEQGSSETLVATVKPDNAMDISVIWESSDNRVARVDGQGCVTAVNEGTATITARAGNKSATCTVNVIGRETKARAILMEFYRAMNGPNWADKTGWGTDAPLNTWSHISYSEHIGVSDITFSGEPNLKGTIPASIGELTSLMSFSIVDAPGITGALPESFGNLVNLYLFRLSGTSVTSVPDIFGGMKNLQIAIISNNDKLTGPLPKSIGDSPVLEFLSIDSNRFTGALPSSWARLGSNLYVSANCLSGVLPEAFLEISDDVWLIDSILYQKEGYGFDLAHVELHGGKYWPEGKVRDVNGTAFSFKEVVAKNKYTVYLFWATWCPFSKTLMPQLKDYYTKYHDSGLEIIATVISADDGGGFITAEDLNKEVKARGYDKWYNYDYFQLGPRTYPSCVPLAEVYDSEGRILFSSFSELKDPVRSRFGKEASSDLFPFLETLLGPASNTEVYIYKDFSKDGEVLTLQKATVGKGINIVFMGDAYVDKDMGAGGLYETVMKEAMEEFFAEEPYKAFRNRFNVYAVKVVSTNDRIGEGCSTALSCQYGSGTHIMGNSDTCYDYAMKVPGIKSRNNLLVCVMVNSTIHKGTANMNYATQSSVAYTSTIGNNPEAYGNVLCHEAGGHGFAFLADEYSLHFEPAPSDHIAQYNDLYNQYGWYSNVDFTDDPSKIRWSSFLSDERYKNLVGIFEGGAFYMTGAWRPTNNSIMNMNMGGFNAPSRWAIYKRIMTLSGEQASFDKFLEYDAINRNKAQSSVVRPPLRAAENAPAAYLAPPVVTP